MMRLGPSGTGLSFVAAAAAALVAGDTATAGSMTAVHSDPLHPSHRMNDRRLPYCSVCGLSGPYRLLWEPCIGAPHPDSDLRFRQAAEKRERKALKRKARP